MERQQILFEGDNHMSTIEVTIKIEELRELEVLISEAQAEADSIRDELKAHMQAQNTEELAAGRYILRWTTILSNRFDSASFKKVMPEIYKAYTKQVSSRRFTISV